MFYLVVFTNNLFTLSIGLFLIGFLGASFIGSNISNSQNKGITIAISSFGFIIGYLVGSIIGDYKKMIIIIANLTTISFILSFLIPIFNETKENTTSEENKISTTKVIMKNWEIYLSLLLRHTGAASIWIYLSYILLNHYHFNLINIGLLQAINILTQTFSNPLVYLLIEKKQKTINLILIGYLLSSIYFLLFPFINNILILSLLQVILGLSFTMLYLGNIEFLIQNNEEKVISITLVSSTFSLANGIGSLIATFLIKLGYIFLFINGFILSLLAFLLTLYFKTKMNKLKLNYSQLKN